MKSLKKRQQEQFTGRNLILKDHIYKWCVGHLNSYLSYRRLIWISFYPRFQSLQCRVVAMEGITGWLSFTLIGTQVWWRRPSSTRTCNRRNAETMDTHLCSWNFLVGSKDKIAPAFTWKPIMNRLNTDMVYSSERQIFDIQTRDIMYNPAPT